MNRFNLFGRRLFLWLLVIVIILLLAGLFIRRRERVSSTADCWTILGDLPEDIWFCGTVVNPRFVIEYGAKLADRFSNDIDLVEMRDDLLKAIDKDILSIEDWRRAGFDPESPILFSIPVLDRSWDSLALIVSLELLDKEQALASLYDIGRLKDLEWRTIQKANYDIHTFDDELFFLVHEQRMYIGIGDDDETAANSLLIIMEGASERLAYNADFQTVRSELPKSNVSAYLPLPPLMNLLRSESHIYPQDLVWIDWISANFRALGIIADEGYGRIILTFAEESEFRDRLQPAGSSRTFTGHFGEPWFALNISLDQPVPLILDLIEQLGGPEALAEFETELQDDLQTDRNQLSIIFEHLTGGFLFYGFKGFFEPEYIVFCQVSEETQKMVAEWILRLSPDLSPRRYGENLLFYDRFGNSLAGFIDGYLVAGNAKRHIINMAEGLYADWQPRGGDSLLSFELRIASILKESGEIISPGAVDAITLLFGEEDDRQYIHGELIRTCNGLVLNAETPVLRMLFGIKP